ncbi:hypothetical protein FB567DRAFT_563181 [Paraphoma chrysanthemicola]|uniref:F-box domain-containing protein n=1 Tax=Paraphoma chrysanthemicola TaxID=798071 RepID=A0A8K0QZK1_9PLEO|nr:hypothetical protein FB567DRAFT_563181 [Paraphoma chrysanthemicola]
MTRDTGSASQSLQSLETTPISSSSPTRSEVLRHVFQRTPRPETRRDILATSYCSKLYTKKPPVRPWPRPRSRVFHKYITGLFSNGHDPGANPKCSHTRSRTSSLGSRPSSSLQGSIPSIDFVSSAAFTFSGPPLRSLSAGSPAASRLPSRAETETDNNTRVLESARTDSFSMIDLASDESEDILEPIIEQGIVRAMSDVLLGVSKPIGKAMSLMAHSANSVGCTQNLDDNATESSHLQALSRVAPTRRDHLDVSILTLTKLLLPHLDPSSRKALRLTSRAWYQVLGTLAPTTFPASYRVPAEILQHMYAYLGPKDFNAARRTCRAWMRASLNRTLLVAMLTRGGWSSSTGAEWTSEAALNPNNTTGSSPSDGWTLSRYLARQCALSSGWTGNGLDERAAVIESSQVDFGELASGYSTLRRDQSGGLLFSASVCGQFLLVARDALIYIYSLSNWTLFPVTSVVCPRRVLSMSMNVSCGRHAVAALLEGRMGIVCELRYGCEDVEAHPIDFDAVDVQSNHQAIGLQGSPKVHAYPSRSSVGTCALSVPIENGKTTFYRHLCSEDDPPRSVSICPQRRCVAFGCSAGIELHWIDALTGQTLNYLHFLAPRPGFESAKKLRLISSAAHPNDRPALRRNLFLSRPTYTSFWGSFGFESSSRHAGSPSCDHYHAVPLSDGHHVLFLDPSNDKLTLGCDAPLGGPTKLLRKLVLIPPKEQVVPRLYTAATDLSQGARIIVAYDNTLILYSIPPDVIHLSQEEQKAESWDIYTQPPFSPQGRPENHWLN